MRCGGRRWRGTAPTRNHPLLDIHPRGIVWLDRARRVQRWIRETLRIGAGGLAAGILGFSFIHVVVAGTAGSDNSLQEITVTATRTSVPLSDALASVTVLTRAEIQARQVLSLQDLFEGEAGIQISNNGGLGKASSVFIRGANADQVLVLIDGVRVGSATLGTTLFQYFPIDQISRVEIVCGPLASLYGSEAMGGVIQIFTGPPKTQGLTVQADAAAGSHETSTIGASVDVGAGPLYYGVSASNLTSNGYPNCTGAPYLSPASPGGGCYVSDPRPDAFHDVSTSAHVGYRFADSFDAVATFMRSQGGARYAGSYTNHQSFVEQVASLAGHWTPTAAVRVTVQGGQSRDNEFDRLDFVEPPGNLFDTLRNSASLQADWTVEEHQILTVGGDYLRDAIASEMIFPVTERRVTSVFAEYQGGYGPLEVTMSGRPRRQQPVRQQVDRQHRARPSLHAESARDGVRRHRFPCTDVQRPVFSRIQQSHAEAGNLAFVRDRRRSEPSGIGLVRACL